MVKNNFDTGATRKKKKRDKPTTAWESYIEEVTVERGMSEVDWDDTNL